MPHTTSNIPLYGKWICFRTSGHKVYKISRASVDGEVEHQKPCLSVNPQGVYPLSFFTSHNPHLSYSLAFLFTPYFICHTDVLLKCLPILLSAKENKITVFFYLRHKRTHKESCIYRTCKIFPDATENKENS